MTEVSTLLFDLLVAGAARCHGAVSDHGGLLLSLFLAGLVGSLSHCAGMCGPFVLAQVSARLETVPARAMSEFSRLNGAALAPYHLGRASTYAALGGLVAGAAGGVARWTEWRGLAGGLLLVGALIFLGYGLQKLGWWAARPGAGTGGWGEAVARLARPLFGRPTGWRGYGLGVLLGFIPCGLLYGALAASASAGDALGGALAMLAFAGGTVPMLVTVGLAGHLAGRRWRGATARLAPWLMILNAGLLSAMAWRLLA